MPITLTPEQQEWIDARVASGDFASAEDAVRQFIDERMFRQEIDEDDLMWAKPLIDEALADIEKGNVMTLEEHRARNAARRAARQS